MNLEERKSNALRLHAEGYNCAQCVILSFPDITNLEPSIVARMAMGMGGGVGAQGEICGVLLGITMVLGFTHGDQPSEKPKVNAEVREITRRFKEQNHGCMLCRELKGKCRKPCDDLITSGIEILHNFLQEGIE